MSTKPTKSKQEQDIRVCPTQSAQFTVEMGWYFRASTLDGLIWDEHTAHMLPDMASVILTLYHIVI
jgi:hypothetical protein